jgi:hypothetical protein
MQEEMVAHMQHHDAIAGTSVDLVNVYFFKKMIDMNLKGIQVILVI